MHGAMYSVLGVIVYNILQYMAKPLHDVAYFPTEFRVIDIVSKRENRNEFHILSSMNLHYF